MTTLADMLRRAAIVAAMAAAPIGLMQLTGAQQPDAPAAPHTAAAAEHSVVGRMAAGWSGEIDYAPPYSALLPTARETSRADGVAFNANDELYGLPRAPGAEDVALYCSACHSLEIVMQQRQTREGWRYLLDWMSAQQGMAPLPQDERQRILDYLSAELGE